jgi:hypothetical protein
MSRFFFFVPGGNDESEKPLCIVYNSYTKKKS